MKKTSNPKRTVSAESIARLADDGGDVSSFFTNTGRMMPPLNLGIDLNENMLEELSKTAKKLNVSRQTLIMRFIQRGLDEQHGRQKNVKRG